MTVRIVKYCEICGTFIKRVPPTYDISTDFSEELCGGDQCIEADDEEALYTYGHDNYGAGV